MSSQQTGGGDQPRPAATPPEPDQPTSQWTATPTPPREQLPPIGAASETHDWNAPPPAGQPTRPGWLLPAAAGLVLLIVVVAIGVYVFLDRGRTAGADDARAGYAYLAPDSALAMELRLDLPAGQREEFVRFATRFPQFADAGQVERQLDQLLNEAIATASGGMANYADDVEPWFAGWIVAGGAVTEEDERGRFMAVIGSTNRPAAEAAMERLRGADSWSSESGPGGVTIWSRLPRFDDSASSYAVTDDAIVLATDPANARAALERNTSDGASLLADESFAAALDRQPAGRMAMFWFDYQALLDAVDDVGGQGPVASPFPFSCPGVPEPRAVSGSLYMQDGRAHIDVALENAPGGQPVQMRDSGLAQRLPADTFLFLSGHDVGGTVSTTLACLRDYPMFGQQLREIETQLGQPIDQLVGWAGDVAVVARFDGSRATGGLLVRMTDQARAAEAMGQIRGLLTAAGGEQGSVSVVEEDYNGARLVTFEFEGGFGAMQPPAPDASFAYAFAGDLLVLGVDASFARAVVDTQADNSLSSDAEFRRAIDAAGGATNAGMAYLDFGTTWRLAEFLLLPVGGGAGNPGLEEVRAVIGALESLAMVSRVEGDTVITRIVLTTRDE